MDLTKEGLIEQKKIEGVGKDHKRHGDNQVPKKEKTSAKRDGKKFNIC